MIKRKIDYQKWTFILSVIGFIGSIGFYLGVLREVYASAEQQNEVEKWKTEVLILKDSLHRVTNQE